MLTLMEHGNTYMKVIFVDENETQYFSEIFNTWFTIELNQVYKLRSVIITN